MDKTRPMLGFITSEGARKLGGEVADFVYTHYNVLLKHLIVCTGGTAGLFDPDWDDAGHKPPIVPRLLKPGNFGGVVELANLVVSGECQTVLFFSDPSDRNAGSVENRVLVRQCIVHDVDLIQNIRTATIWVRKTNIDIEASYGEQTVALIANDGKKDAMYRFVAQNQKFLAHFGRIICTGTTGANLAEFVVPHLADKIQRFNSGPNGGDVQIANEIVEGRCHHVVFFIDPFDAHPHSDDIEFFVRVCQQFEGVDVNFMVTQKSAKRWMETVRADLSK